MSDTPTISELQLERLALGELPPAEATALRARLTAADQARLAAITTSNAEILAAHPPAAVRREVERRRAAQRRAPRALWLATPLAAAAATALVLWPVDPPIEAPAPEPATQVVTPPRPDPGATRMDPGATRIKGQEPHILVYRQAGDQAVPLTEPAEARAHDRLQLGYVAAGALHGVLVSLDGASVVTLHYPASETASTALQQGGPVPLGSSYELDAAPAFERFILVTADRPIDPASIITATQLLTGQPQPATTPLVLPPELRQRSFLLRKVAP